MRIALSPRMAGLVADEVTRTAPGAGLMTIEPGAAIPADALAETQILFLSSDLIEAMKYDRNFEAQCADLVETAPLQWVQSGSSGHERPIFARICARGARLTTAAGIHSVPIAHYVLSHMLAHAKRHRAHAAQQSARLWEQVTQDELTGMTVGVLGLGSIGLEVARLCRAFGMRVSGLKRSPDAAPQVDRLYGPDDLARLARESDYLVVALPQSAQTEGVVSREILREMKPGAVLINISRGAIVDEAALVEGLRAGRPAAAVLDVTAVEPLPEASPLWTLPNVILTPHDSAWSPRTYDRLGALFCENLRRFVAGDGMCNEVAAPNPASNSPTVRGDLP